MKRPYVGSNIVQLDKDGAFVLSAYMCNRAMERSPNRTMFVGPSLKDSCLMLFDETSALDLLDDGDDDNARYFSLLEPVILGPGGKIHLPTIVKASGYLDDSVMIVSAGDRLELWNPKVAAAHRDPYLSCAAAVQGWLKAPEADRQDNVPQLANLMDYRARKAMRVPLLDAA